MTFFSSTSRYNVIDTTLDISYDNLNSSPKTQVFLKKNLTPVTGIVYSLNDLGKLRFEISFNSGLADGLFQVWNFDEKLIWQFNYRNGMKHGEYKLWYANGQLMELGRYEFDKKAGICRLWHESGKLYIVRNYEKGVLHGNEKRYFQNGHEGKEYFYYLGKLIDNKSYKFNKIQNWEGKRLTKYLNLDFINHFTNGILESETLFFSIITQEGQKALLQGGLDSFNKQKGLKYFMPLLKVSKKYYNNGKLKSEIFTASAYYGQCIMSRTWNKMGELISFEKPNKNIPNLILQYSSNFDEIDNIKNEEIKCYWKNFESIFFITFRKEWYECGKMKLSEISDNFNVKWIKHEWDDNGLKSDFMIDWFNK